MNLFIEENRHRSERADLESDSRILWSPSIGRECPGDLDEAPGFETPSKVGVLSGRRPPICDRGRIPEQGPLVREAYRQALTYDLRRERRARVLRIARTIALVVATPLLLALVFVASYALTLIASGATPEELMGLMAGFLERVAGFAGELAMLG
ncbi:MAG: hypothetical protein SOU51_02200 [Collinsella sp.]|nr:hypothetical protein [Collinsella sp.]